MGRSADFDLAAALAKPSFTPAQRDVGALVDLVVRGEEPHATRAQVALAKLGAVGRGAILARLETARESSGALDDGAAARLVGGLGLLARTGDPEARTAVIARANDSAVRVRRAAIGALGKLDGDDARAAVIARWDATDVTPDERRTLAEALGKLGGEPAMARLKAASVGDDGELARRRDRAVLMADRAARREIESAIAIDRAPPAPVTVRLGCRPGLGPLLVEELGALELAPRSTRDDGAEITLAGPWSALFASRLWATAAIRLPFGTASKPAKGAVPRADRIADPEALGAAIVDAITRPEVRALLAAQTIGAIRWRLGFAKGHKRAVVWRVARDVTAAAPELINDPTATTWDFVVDDEAGTLDLVPRRLTDPRWAWRVAEVPAASHPSVAAALVHVAGVRAGERVWDPFCGSGLELIEAARRGAHAYGTDLDDAALDAARENAANAMLAKPDQRDATSTSSGGTVTFARSDARRFEPPAPLDVIVTNPPLGSRVRIDAVALLVEALPHFAAQLAPRGRLVWITPATKKTSPVAERLGLQRLRMLPVDLGGVRGHLEAWRRRD